MTKFPLFCCCSQQRLQPYSLLWLESQTGKIYYSCSVSGLWEVKFHQDSDVLTHRNFPQWSLRLRYHPSFQTESPDWWTPVLLELQLDSLLLGDPTLAAGCGRDTIRIRGRFTQKSLGVILRGARAEEIRGGRNWGSYRVWLRWPSLAPRSPEQKSSSHCCGIFSAWVLCTQNSTAGFKTCGPALVNIMAAHYPLVARLIGCRQPDTYAPHDSVQVSSFSLESRMLL